MAAIIPAVAVGIAVGEQLPKFFDDAFDQLGAGEGIYLRDGVPSSLPVQIGQAVGRAYCRAYGATDTQYPPGKGERIEKACRPYLDSLNPASGPGIELPFRGGQCLCTLYSVNIITTYTRLSTGASFTFNQVRRCRGPLAGFTAERFSDTDPNLTFVYRANAVGTDSSSNPGCNPAGTVVTRRERTSAPESIDGNYPVVDIVITVLSGPDDCGNPQPIVTLPPTTPDPTPPPFRFNPEPGIDIDIDVEIGPDGDVTFDIGTGPITVDPFGGGGGGGGGGGDQPEPGSPGTGQETGGGAGGAGGSTEGEAPPGSVLTGLKVSILERPLSARRFSDEVDRGVAYVYMGTPAEGLALEPSGANLRSGQFVFAQKDYLTSWAVRATPGYNLLVIPYYRERAEDGATTD